jgi:hypothetical protein
MTMGFGGELLGGINNESRVLEVMGVLLLVLVPGE